MKTGICQRVVAAPDIICGHPVKSGGNMHKIGRCPAKAGPWGNHRARKSRKNKKREKDIIVERGAPVVGTGKKGKGEKKGKKG